MKIKTSSLAAVLILLSASISGCCSGSGCGLLGKSGAIKSQAISPAACSTCSSPVVMDQYHAGVENVTEFADYAPTRVAQVPQLQPSWVGSSSPVSTPKSCGSS